MRAFPTFAYDLHLPAFFSLKLNPSMKTAGNVANLAMPIFVGFFFALLFILYVFNKTLANLFISFSKKKID